MPKAEISWKRVTDAGVKLQVYAQRVSRDWRFFARAKRFDQKLPAGGLLLTGIEQNSVFRRLAPA